MLESWQRDGTYPVTTCPPSRARTTRATPAGRAAPGGPRPSSTSVCNDLGLRPDQTVVYICGNPDMILNVEVAPDGRAASRVPRQEGALLAEGQGRAPGSTRRRRLTIRDLRRPRGAPLGISPRSCGQGADDGLRDRHRHPLRVSARCTRSSTATVLSPNVTRLVVEAPRIAQIRQPGQFVIVRRGPGAERIPLTIADGDAAAGTITLVIQAVGKSTSDLVELQVGEAIHDVAGPLGRPTELIESGHAVCVGGGVGTAVVHPIAQGLHARGVRVTSVIGGRSREWVILEDELRRARRGHRLHRRRLVRPARLRDRRRWPTCSPAATSTAVYAVGPVPDDARRRRADAAARRAHDRVAQPDHGRRHRHVRRLPRVGRRR